MEEAGGRVITTGKEVTGYGKLEMGDFLEERVNCLSDYLYAGVIKTATNYSLG